MKRSTRDTTVPSRRRFLAAASAAAAATAAPRLRAQQEPVLLPPYIADIDGDGQLNAVDEEIARTALFAQRGFALEPRPGFDQRTDVFGRGAVDPLVVDSVRHSIAQHAQDATPAMARPITVAWHYGWYNLHDRPPGLQTARLKGGNYVSSDPVIEGTFHDLKNEFGVTVDALSWIPVRANKDNQGNYRKGFLAAPNVATRYIAMLYESIIALPRIGDRIDFQSETVQRLFREDFANMARFLVEVRDDTPSRIFTLDDRPVVFIFGSHTWGLFPVPGPAFQAVEGIVRDTREIFRDIYGAYPYLVGEEMVLSTEGRIADDRIQRILMFDAIYIYHHASNLKQGVEATLFMSDSYIRNQLGILRKTYEALQYLRNRYTGRPVLVIPNLAPGFAKPDHPTLQIGRGEYTDFMKRIQQFHLKEYIRRDWRELLGSTLLPAPIYVVGSWNEEFEGHAILPYDFNFSVPEDVQYGFDLVMAIKEAFGWNHYAVRDITGTPPPDIRFEPPVF